MNNGTYLERLASRMANGMARLPDELRDRQTAYIASLQGPDGGFPGREGGSDLYYTGFALRSLTALDALTSDISQRAGNFLRQSLAQQASVVDFFSFLYACLLIQMRGGPDVLAASSTDWPERVAETMETFRTPDGGYAKSPGSNSGSTYHTFLVGLTYQLLGKGLPDSEKVIQFVQARRREDGGYVEIAPMRRSGTNPTAAAVGILQMFGATDISECVGAFLAEMPSIEGGFRANGRAPLADLLSTFTGVWTLDQLAALESVDTVAARRYAENLALPLGGFRGGLWDDRADVEYTFYGLGVLALLTT
jgi:geranylgeranyl transferase type-2 subunit beta